MAKKKTKRRSGGKSTPNVRRIETGNTRGWQFHCNVSGFAKTKLFSDRVYGGNRKAKLAAIEFRDQYMADVPDPRLRIEMKTNRNNSTGVIGVSMVWRGEVPYMQASCSTNEGTRLTKNFNVNDLGEEEALKKARNWRRSQLRKRKKELEAVHNSKS